MDPNPFSRAERRWRAQRAFAIRIEQYSVAARQRLLWTERCATGSVFAYLRAVSGLLALFFFQAEDGIRDDLVTGVQTCALPISRRRMRMRARQIVMSCYPSCC